MILGPFVAPGGHERRTIFSDVPFVSAVAHIRLKVGDWQSVQEVGNENAKITFNVPLDQADYEVKADMLDAQKEVIAGAYYVYCTRLK